MKYTANMTIDSYTQSTTQTFVFIITSESIQSVTKQKQVAL